VPATQRLQSVTIARYQAVPFHNYQPNRLLNFDSWISLLTQNTPKRQRFAPDFLGYKKNDRLMDTISAAVCQIRGYLFPGD
jgi:hypothetical protein